jgi:hypothetical protein
VSAPRVHPNAQLLGVRQAAAELGIGTNTLRGLVRDRIVPVVNIPGVRKYFIDRRDLERLIASWKVKAS